VFELLKSFYYSRYLPLITNLPFNNKKGFDKMILCCLWVVLESQPQHTPYQVVLLSSIIRIFSEGALDNILIL
jgi:hypothetical protein